MEEPPRSVPVGLNHKDGGDRKDGEGTAGEVSAGADDVESPRASGE